MAVLNSTVGQIMINEALPPDLRDYNRVLNKTGVKALLQEVAEKYPDRYREISKRLLDIGRHAAYTSGGHSFGLKALRPALSGKIIRDELRSRVRKILARRLPEEQRNKVLVDTIGEYSEQLRKAVEDESKLEQNPLALQLMGAGRGNPASLNSIRGADLLYADHRGDAIPIPVLRNYSEGLTPIEYMAGAFGARKGILDLKNATADAGFFSKQLTQMTHRLLVTADDDDEPYDEKSPRGYPVSTDDNDSEGGLLAHPIGGYARNTQLTPKILKDLKQRGIDEILVRSPIVGGPLDGGVYGRDVGRRERGMIAPEGDWVGIAAANAIGEPVTQGSIGSKHTGGVASASGGAVGGFPAINNLVQSPEHYPGGATHSELDGRVQSVAKAPQGGFYITVGGKQHYSTSEPTVKRGDVVEAGDVLSQGIPIPAEVVKYKGIGEGRRYFIDAFRNTLKASNIPGNRRNIELIARGLINHVRLDDELGDWAPGDIVPYQTLERQWQPREGATALNPSAAVGQYLEQPVLHYSVGTKIGQKAAAQMAKHGITTVQAHRQAPPFSPVMIRAMASIGEDPDPFTRFLGSYQERSLTKAVHRGDVSDTAGTSYVPALMEGQSFGDTDLTKGWQS